MHRSGAEEWCVVHTVMWCVGAVQCGAVVQWCMQCMCSAVPCIHAVMWFIQCCECGVVVRCGAVVQCM
jgi:hypothetical protein